MTPSQTWRPRSRPSSTACLPRPLGKCECHSLQAPTTRVWPRHQPHSTPAGSALMLSAFESHWKRSGWTTTTLRSIRMRLTQTAATPKHRSASTRSAGAIPSGSSARREVLCLRLTTAVLALPTAWCAWSTSRRSIRTSRCFPVRPADGRTCGSGRCTRMRRSSRITTACSCHKTRRGESGHAPR